MSGSPEVSSIQAKAPNSISGNTQTVSSPLLNCHKCGDPVTGQYVRALNSIFHANCFRCQDCDAAVSAKFFSFSTPDGQQVPLCEVDYFKRLDLICAKCGQALRGSYITAVDKKYHVHHFTCCCCDTVFGPQDSYYEHETEVYCHFHYSTRCAQKCSSCQTAILRQFVEVNKGSRDEAYHPPCHLIQKFWNVKMAAPSPQPPTGQERWTYEETHYTRESLRESQKRMDERIHRVWTVLSAFEESSAACISDLLKYVSDGVYLEAIRSAERFIFHVEVLFASLDDLDFAFRRHSASKAVPHVRESRMLCRKTVDLFTQLSHSQKDISRQGMTQELLVLITGIAHYLKILIRIALQGALQLEREFGDLNGLNSILDQLHHLAEENGNPMAKRVLALKRGNGVEGADVRRDDVNRIQPRSREGVAFGFKSLAPEFAGRSPYIQEYDDVRDGTKLSANFIPPSDLCVACKVTIEDDCVRLGTFLRWHPQCLICSSCSKSAAIAPPEIKPESKDTTHKEEGGNEDIEETNQGSKIATQQRVKPTVEAESFAYKAETIVAAPSASLPTNSVALPAIIFCIDHKQGDYRVGFQIVSQLEQYAYLLNVALRRLYSILKRRGAIAPPTGPLVQPSGSPRESVELGRMRSVNLAERKTTVRKPKQSTVLESPSGKAAQETDVSSTSVLIMNSPPKYKPRSPPPISTPAVIPKDSAVKKPSSVASSTANEGNQTSQPFRPAFARYNSQIVVVDDDHALPPLPLEEDPIVTQEPETDEALMLDEIPHLVEAELAKERKRTSLPGSVNDAPLLSDLDPLDSAIVKHAAVWLLNHSELKDRFDLDEVLECIEVRKGGLIQRLFRAERKPKKKGTFGIPLEVLTEKDGVDSLLGVSRGTVRIPAFLDDVISALKQMDVSVEGIFRKNGNIRRLKETIDMLDREPGSVDFSTENPIQLAALLKKFFMELPDPLLTHRLYGLFIATQSIPSFEERSRLLHLVSVLLPKSHRSTMEVFFVFLKWVSLFSNVDSAGSKMDLPNIAVVIAPSILSMKGGDGIRDQSFLAINVVTQMLEQQDALNIVPRQCLPILEDRKEFVKYMGESSKEILKKCDQHFRGKKVGSGIGSPVMSTSNLHFLSGSGLPNHKSDPSLDIRGRSQQPGQKKERLSHSQERSQERDNRNSGTPGKKSKLPHPGLTHAPFSSPAFSGIPSGPRSPDGLSSLGLRLPLPSTIPESPPTSSHGH